MDDRGVSQTMLGTIQKIFEQNRELVTQTEKAIIYLREQEYEKALTILLSTKEYINYVSETIINQREYFQLVSIDSVEEMLEGITEAKRQKDYVLLADLLELQLVNFLCSVQEFIMKKEDFLVYNELEYIKNSSVVQQKIMDSDQTLPYLTEESKIKQGQILDKELSENLDPAYLLDQGYLVEFTTSGAMTIGAKDANGTKFYMHSNHIVGKEAFLQAKKWYSEKVNTYIVYGYGLGYHIRELLNLAPDANIEIYESDMNILKLSCAFSKMTALLEYDNVKLFYDPEYTRIKKRLQQLEECDKVCIHYPSLRNVKMPEAKEMLLNYVPCAMAVEA